MDQTPPVRVLINALHAKSGGGVTYLRAMLPLLAADERLELILLIHRHTLPLFQPLDPRIIVHALDLPAGMAREMLWEQVSLPGLVKRLGADVVFSPANFGPLALRNQVIVLRNDVTVGKGETRLAKKMYWWALTALTTLSLWRVRRAIAVSAYAAGVLSGPFRRKVSVVHHGVAPLFCPDDGVARGDFLLAVSDIYVQKNFLTLVRALAVLRQAHPQICLKVAGKIVDPWYHAQVMELAEQLGVAHAVEFLGRADAESLRDLYRTCRLFVFPSTAETFGNPLVEAMACGAPVVCSNTTAMPEVTGGAALLCDPLDADALAGQLARVVEDVALARHLSHAAVRRAGAFSWERTAKATADLLLDATGVDGTRPKMVKVAPI